jgi:hypothetical protein
LSRNRAGNDDVYEALIDGPSAVERARRIVAAAEAVEAYAHTHDRVVALGEEDSSRQADLKAALADRAFGAETAVRSLIGDHLDALNELRDAGALPVAIKRASQALEKHDFDWRRILRAASDGVEKFGIDPSVLERAAERIDDLGLELSPAGGGAIGGAIVNLHGKKEKFRVRGKMAPGDLARVSREDLLAANGIVPSAPILVATDCHHRERPMLHTHDEPIALYGTNVAGLAYARETAYLHARTMAELGPSAFRGKAPAVAIGIGIIVVGVIIAGVGVAMVASGNSGGWGLIVIGGIIVAGGICVAVGACNFVVSLFMHVEA